MLVRRFTSAIGVAAYLLATTASGLLHDHHLHDTGRHDCHLHHHGPHHHHHETDCATAGRGHSEHDDRSLPPVQHDDCAVCQFAGQLSVPIAVVELTRSPGIVAELPETAPEFWCDLSLDGPRSRGPPI